MASQVNIQGIITSTPVGTQKIGILTVTNTVNIASVTAIPMSATVTSTITVPATSVACIIVPPANNPATISFKTSLNSGDTGLPIAPTQPSLVSFPATIPTTMTFTIGATFSGIIEVKFF